MSTPEIHKLDSHVIDHIAAGEVVERPASVVKELLENAFDAGASLVQVELGGGGLDRITITDDGHGMRPEDAKRCILRHATSKLRQASDLFCIRTLGFRGEALSSIAAIAKLTITTRTKDAPVGFRIVIHGGKLISAEAAGCPEGTCIDVDALFYNTPARRKFMRAPATEQAHVIEAGLRVALGAQKGGLVICSGSRRLLDIPEDIPLDGALALAEQQRARLHSALGHRLGTLTPVYGKDGDFVVSGFVSEPQLSRSETRGLWLFVNGRFVRDRMLQRAVLDSFSVHCPKGYPTVVLWLTLNPEAVDINVHPQKLEVRFADAHRVYRVVGEAVATAVRPAGAALGLPLVQTDADLRGFGQNLAPVAQTPRLFAAPSTAAQAQHTAQLRLGNTQRVASATRRFFAAASAIDKARAHAPNASLKRVAIPFAKAKTGPSWRPASARSSSGQNLAAPAAHIAQQGWLPALPEAAQAPQKALPPSRSFRHVQPLTAVAPGFVLGRLGEDVVLIDGMQAARHLVSAQLAREHACGGLVRHTLMLPPTFLAPKAWAQRLVKSWEDLRAWGLELDCVGPDQYAVRAMPQALEGCDPVEVAKSCLDVVLRMQDLQDAPAIRRSVEARWLQLVPWTRQVAHTQAPEDHKAMQHLLDTLADAQLDIETVGFAKRLNASHWAPLLH